jgi:hypothetical protein
MMTDYFGPGVLFLDDGHTSWSVICRLRTREETHGRTDVTGTLEPLPRITGERTGPIVQEISEHTVDPNAVLSLQLKKSGAWVFVQVTGSTNGVFDVGADSHMIDAPAWAKKGGG